MNLDAAVFGRTTVAHVSMPVVPGYIERPSGNTLADLWARPAGNFPDELWPLHIMRSATPEPTGWLTASEHFFTDAMHGGCGCVLVDPDDAAAALKQTSWIGHDLGDVSVWDGGGFDHGLEIVDHDVKVEFLLQGRTASGSSLPLIEVSHPFVWYWDAFPVTDGWRYLNHAGREQELIRWERTAERWKIEVRALELRQFLAACGRDAVLQMDYVPKVEAENFDRVDDEFRSAWGHFDFHATVEPSMGDRPGFSRICGQYLIRGARNDRVPRFEERRQDRSFPDFIYEVDGRTGEFLRHSCDPDALGTYFDKDNSRLHYLTPVYFKREVLQPYQAEPNRYRLTPHRIECLNLWGISMSFNTEGLVEVYLGDLGRDLPSDEWGHWLTYNVVPEGEMEEGRFRRDFLNQPTSSPDIPGDLRRARDRAAEESQRLLGAPIWRALEGDTAAEFASMVGPLSNDTASLGPSLLLVTKTLVDGIDPRPLRKYLGDAQPDERSLSLLRRFAEQLGDTSDVTATLRDLQTFRSKGGVAHLAGSGRAKALALLGITGLSSLDAFNSVAGRLTKCLLDLTALMKTIDGHQGNHAPGQASD